MLNKLILLPALLLLPLAPPSFADPINVEGAELRWHKYHDHIHISTSDFIRPRVSAQPDRIVLTFPGARTAGFTATLEKSPRIRVVRGEGAGTDGARVVIELKKRVNHEVATFIGRNQVFVEIAETERPRRFFAEDEPAPVAERKPVARAVRAYTPVKGETITVRTATPLRQEGRGVEKPLKGKVIVVDPGHGGDDPGALAFDKTPEKELTLKTGILLAEELQKEGATVFLTRKTDTRKDLKEIAAYVNRVGANMYIAVHFNSLDRPMIGTETYYYTPQSFRLAQLVHKRMVTSLKRPDRGVKRANFYTIARAKMPAILIEPVYITDMQEGVLAKSASFQREIARAVTLGVKDYYLR